MSVRFFSIFRFALHWSCSASGYRQTRRAAIAYRQTRCWGSDDRDNIDARRNGSFNTCALASNRAGSAVRSCCCCVSRNYRQLVSWMREYLHSGDTVREPGGRTTRYAEGSVLRAGNSPALRSTASLLASGHSDCELVAADVRKSGARRGGAALHLRTTGARRDGSVVPDSYGLRLLVNLLRSSCERSRRGSSEPSGGSNIFRHCCNFVRASRVCFQFAHGVCFRVATLVDWRWRASSSLGGERMRLACS